MATKSKASEMADHYIGLLADWAEVTRKPLFGAIALRRNDLVFGMIWKGGLYFKTDEQSVQEYDAASSGKLGYTTNEGESRALKSYAEVPPEVSEDDEKLCEWAETAYQAALNSAARS
ncbi:TfoX/Sxy family protein [Mesorhizobium sp. WSM2561]|uniref:TfoX/Sxy family protein n=1 Tax=Mesorhizobium sp. WSM2561 TaxID=1040985 RepID=UPI0004855DB5|nr:TfoX/Sxy family protein [Mesorhizobium sp. WSM2561]